MIDRIAQQMEQRIGQLVEHISVHLNLAAVDNQLCLLAGLLAGLAHIAQQARRQHTHWRKTCGNNLVLEFFVDIGLLSHFGA